MLEISELRLRNGTLGISPMPGGGGRYEADLMKILRWGAGLVLTMTTEEELENSGAEGLGGDLRAVGIAWRHLPIADFGAPSEEVAGLWPEASALAHRILDDGGRVLVHCYGGCGRSGMALLRLMVEAGEDADPALARLRRVRACAVEAESQRAWAALPMNQRSGKSA